jgi:hypothetical protein
LYIIISSLFKIANRVTDQDVKEDSELIFGANATIHDLSDFNFHNKIRLLKIDYKIKALCEIG